MSLTSEELQGIGVPKVMKELGQAFPLRKASLKQK
jgi:hypothetical protein